MGIIEIDRRILDLQCMDVESNHYGEWKQEILELRERRRKLVMEKELIDNGIFT